MTRANATSNAAATLAVAFVLGTACAFALPGCGGTTATVLERIDAATPPLSNVRVDVILLRSVSTCAVGSPCTGSASQCYTLSDALGPRIGFAPQSVRFVAPNATETTTFAQVACFRLDLDDAGVAAARAAIGDLAARVFNASDGNINLNVRFSEIASLDTDFSSFDQGPFLDPSGLGTTGLSLVNRETDFSYAITGYKSSDPNGLIPHMDHCAGTNGIAQGLLGGSPYTWIAMEPRCAQPETFLSSWSYQFFFGRRQASAAPDLYDDRYPRCGLGDPDPTRWFPWTEHCTSDPDWTACGRNFCPDTMAFYSHVIAKHWPRGQIYNGNYCANGRMDTASGLDETGVDVGGTCALLGTR